MWALSDRQVTVRVQDGEYKTAAAMYRGDGPTNGGAKQMGKKNAGKHGCRVTGPRSGT